MTSLIVLFPSHTWLCTKPISAKHFYLFVYGSYQLYESFVGKQIQKQNNINKGKLVETWLMAWNGRLISETMSSLRERLLPHHPNNGKGLITDTFQFYLSLSLKKSICLALAMLLFKWELFSSRYNGNCSSIDVISFFISELCLAYWYL